MKIVRSILAMGFIVFVIAVMLYAFKGVYINTKSFATMWKWIIWVGYWLVMAATFWAWLYNSNNWSELRANHPQLQELIMGAIITVVVSCCVLVIFNLIEDLVHFVRWLRMRSTTEIPLDSDATLPTISRWKFISQVGLGLGAITFGSFLWGITRGKFNFRVIRQNLAFANLPKAFDGVKIVQISDAHLGSFAGQFEQIQEAITMINSLDADYVVFTGDLVNSEEQEADDWVDIFSGIKAKRGKYAILGNHDYGYYSNFDDSRQAQVKTGVVERLQAMGFTPLLNEHRVLEHEGEKIGLLGVENWGKSHWFPKDGDLEKAREGMEDVPFKILLSHDPTHWEEHIMGKEDIDLTLSGHTHGAQMGISIPGVLEISPARLMFKRWAGLYTEGKNNLYINRGFGYLIFPGRVGMSPEITLLELNKA
ncbi:MAG: metallophosphoesterase [Flavobacteriales bacterium]|nr:metallophosphoesterase [Flavobacteriales bacterium]